MKKLLYTTTAFVLCGGIVQANAACIATPSCTAMGYTEASCPNGGVKCPWGDKWFCSSSETEICSKFGFNYTCSGTGYAGGAGSACGGKYVSCECAEGYRWENNTCKQHAVFGQCLGYAKQCSLGDILFSDGTCSANTVSGKTPIAVVVYKSGSCGQALALKSIGDYEWGGYGTDISGLTNYSTQSAASKDYDSCGNSKKIMAAGDKSKYPAVWAANEYKTEGTSAGDWCLPAAGIITSYYNNQTAINLGFDKAGGTTVTDSTSTWLSSEYYGYYGSNAWGSDFSIYGSGLNWYDKNDTNEVRPVIEF